MRYTRLLPHTKQSKTIFISLKTYTPNHNENKEQEKYVICHFIKSFIFSAIKNMAVPTSDTKLMANIGDKTRA